VMHVSCAVSPCVDCGACTVVLLCRLSVCCVACCLLCRLWVHALAVFNIIYIYLLGEARGGILRVFSHAGINIEHKKSVYWGGLGGADHNGRVRKAPFSTVDGL